MKRTVSLTFAAFAFAASATMASPACAQSDLHTAWGRYLGWGSGPGYHSYSQDQVHAWAACDHQDGVNCETCTSPTPTTVSTNHDLTRPPQSAPTPAFHDQPASPTPARPQGAFPGRGPSGRQIVPPQPPQHGRPVVAPEQVLPAPINWSPAAQYVPAAPIRYAPAARIQYVPAAPMHYVTSAPMQLTGFPPNVPSWQPVAATSPGPLPTSQFQVPSQYSAAQYSAAQYSAAQYSAAQYNAAQYNAAQYNAPQYVPSQYSAQQYVPAFYNTCPRNRDWSCRTREIH